MLKYYPKRTNLLEVRIGEYLMVVSEESSIKDVSAVHLLSHISKISKSAGQ